MFKYNKPTDGVPKIGFAGGDAFPPGKFIVGFAKAKERTSQNKKTGQAGQPQVVTEWNVLEVVRKDYPEDGFKTWNGQVLTAKEGVRRSYVLKMNYPGAIGDLNELVIMLHGIDAKNPSALRAAGLVPMNDSAAEIDRVANKLNEMIEFAFKDENPFMDYILALEVTEKKNADNGHTFMAMRIEQLPAAAEDNAKVLAKAGVKAAA